MNRRDFMGWLGVGAIASSLPVALAACTPQSQQSSTPQTIGTLAELDQQGKLFVELASGPVLAIRNPANAEQIIAVNPTCTHRGCIVEWEGDQSAFVCPCHAAKFSTDGGVVGGPAEDSLALLAVTIDGDSIVVGGAA